MIWSLAAAASVLVCPVFCSTDDSARQIRIVYTNDTMGYLEPCGCGGHYVGGLARRAAAMAKILKTQPNTVIIDSGNLASTPDKLGIICRIMAEMGYQATGVGSLDSMYREEFLKQTAANGLKVLDTTQAEAKNIVPYLIKNVSGVRVGVVSFGGNLRKGTSLPEAFVTTYNAARRASDVLVLLDQGGLASPEWLESVAGNPGPPDIVIGGAARGVNVGDKIIGKTHIVPVSQFGKYLGVADVQMAEDGSLRITAEAVLIDNNTKEDEAVKKQVDDFLQKPKAPATLSPSMLNFGSVKKGSTKEEYVTLTPTGSAQLIIGKSSSSSTRVTAPDWTRSPDGSYKIRIVIDGGDTTGRLLETVSFVLDLPDEPTLNLRVFGNVLDE